MNLERVIAVRTSKTVYRDGDTAVKVFNEDYQKADVLNEALNQARMEETALNVPKVLSVTKLDGKWAIISEFIRGTTLERLMQKNPERRDDDLNLFTDLQIRVHAQRSPLLTKLRDKMNRKIAQTELDATTRYELHTRLEGMPRHDKVCHGDFNPSNIIITDAGEAYILDWSHVTQGNAAADVARTYLLFKLSGDDETAEKYLSLYCEKTSTDIRYIQKWLPIVAASQSVKGKPQEREMLLKWVDVVDYE